ncbi:hypothetical protein HGRIS_011122 [Hohenbuehelia grisea]|uniref:Extracellular membrane protein CFEM domain-containing protein n=1 Tax=Hohenbuehelia grisea TaxID=104357 RepID=A0ABR3IYW3_9AGAR
MWRLPSPVIILVGSSFLFVHANANLGLHLRQAAPLNLNDFPAQCQSDCSPAVSVANNANCQLAACQCTTTNIQSLAKCFDCVVTASGNADAIRENAQTAVNGFRDSCAQSGINLPSQTVGGSSAAFSSAAPGAFSSSGLFTSGGGATRSAGFPAVTISAGPGGTVPSGISGSGGSTGSSGNSGGSGSSGDEGNSDSIGGANSPLGGPPRNVATGRTISLGFAIAGVGGGLAVLL